MERGRRRAKNVAKKWAEKKVFIGGTAPSPYPNTQKQKVMSIMVRRGRRTSSVTIDCLHRMLLVHLF